MKYKPTIGLEVHAELKTKSKMFCGCENNPHAAEHNQLVCPVCTAQPGALPVPNKTAIQYVLLFGNAVGATTATFSEFDRKSYFYPDIPKAYQISQYEFPFLSGGTLSGIDLTRVHLEEDTARNQHGDDHSLVDFNRAGVPLMELVTEPVIHDAETAGKFAKELQLLLRTLNISDANMEKGEMRVEANISVSDTDELGVKVEVKNLNSFKSVEGAIAYEIERQIALIEAGEAISQETRGWDEVKNKTFTQRTKETAKDYRYFPDPDIPKIDTTSVAEFSKSSLSEITPELPSKTREIYTNLGLTSEVIEQILSDSIINSIVKMILSEQKDITSSTFKLVTNYLLTDVSPILSSQAEYNSTEFPVVEYLKMVEMLESKTINSRTAKNILPLILTEGINVQEYAEKHNLIQVQDTEALEKIVDQIIQENESVVDEYKAGKETSIKFLVGQGMKLSKGTADPELLLELIKAKI